MKGIKYKWAIEVIETDIAKIVIKYDSKNNIAISNVIFKTGETK